MSDLRFSPRILHLGPARLRVEVVEREWSYADHLRSDDQMIRQIMEGSGPGMVYRVSEQQAPTTGREYALAVMSENAAPTLKPLALVESGAKTRIATLHDASSVHASRILTRCMGPLLKVLHCTRDILTGREVTLSQNTENAQLYSADLSAATDYIHHDLARFVWAEWCQSLGIDSELQRMGHRLLGPHMDIGQDPPQETSRGVHMGEGISWSILCLINGWAAWQAGASKDSYAICGDDLIGFWSRETADRYEANLEHVGLVINKSKSFFSPKGVFCERLVEVCQDGKARSVQRLTMAEAGGQKHGWGLGENWQSVLQHLEAKVLHWRQTNARDPLHDLVLDTMQRIKPHKSAPGPTCVGGSGLGQVKPELLIGHLSLNGKMPRAGPPCNAEDRAIYATLAEKQSTICTRGGHSAIASEFLKEVQIHMGVRDSLAGQSPHSQCATYKAWRSSAARKCKAGRTVLKSQDLIQAINTCSYLPLRVKRNALWRLRLRGRKTPLTEVKLNWLARMIRPKNYFLDLETQNEVLMNFGPNVRESLQDRVSEDFSIRKGLQAHAQPFG